MRGLLAARHRHECFSFRATCNEPFQLLVSADHVGHQDAHALALWSKTPAFPFSDQPGLPGSHAGEAADGSEPFRHARLIHAELLCGVGCIPLVFGQGDEGFEQLQRKARWPWHGGRSPFFFRPLAPAQPVRTIQCIPTWLFFQDDTKKGNGDRHEPERQVQMAVRFSGRVRDKLPDDLRAQLEVELENAFQELDPKHSAVEIYVPRTFSGHSPKFQQKVILAVEVTYADGYERHIVKVGDRKKVEPDFTGWQKCTNKRMVASRIFVPVRLLDWKADRVAVLYRDAFTLFGPDAHENSKFQPTMLEEAILWVVKDDEPDLLSAERALAQVFTDLGLWFYRGAKVEAEPALSFYMGHLRRRPQDEAKDDVLAAWHDNPNRRDLRRQAVWVLAGRDAPDADPVENRARYLDPIDYVAWAITDPKRIPKTLVGRSHGDLHARNVLVGVRRGEVQYPAVFDYGDMSDSNVLAWDFAKLENELKARLLPVIMGDGSVSSFLIARSNLRKLPQDIPCPGVRSVNADRADRLAAFLAFEEILDDLTESLCTSSDAERIRPFRQPPTGLPKLDRLAAVLMRVRREAATWLGFAVPERKTAWRDELYFALGIYGLLNVRWDYSQPEQEAALVSAGVALARMPSMPSFLKDCIAAGPTPGKPYPSYRVPLAILYDMWKTKKYEAGCQFAEQVAVAVANPNDPRSCRISIRPEAYHAIPLVGQALLLETEIGNLHAVERVLEASVPRQENSGTTKPLHGLAACTRNPEIASGRPRRVGKPSVPHDRRGSKCSIYAGRLR